MGLDLALGLIVFTSALRGWFKGFVTQAVRIGGFIACFYLADPVREQVQPYVLSKLPTVDAGLMNRILWWVAAVISYVMLVGLTSLAIQLTRSPAPNKIPGARRDDQFGGMLLGAAKGLLIASFLAAAVANYGTEIAHSIPWAERQTTGSYALKWTDQYHPASRIWAAPPVRSFVQHIQRNGLKGSTEADSGSQVATQNMSGAEVATRIPRLDLTPKAPRSRPWQPGA